MPSPRERRNQISKNRKRRQKRAKGNYKPYSGAEAEGPGLPGNPPGSRKIREREEGNRFSY